MTFSEKWGTSVDEAVQLALQDLGLSIDEVIVTVLEEPTRGFFGIGSKLAFVRVESKKAKEEEEAKEKAKAQKIIKQDKPAVQEKDNKVSKEATEKTITNNNKVKKDKPVRKEAMKFELPTEPIIAQVPETDLEEIKDHKALTFLADVVKEMGLEVEITAKGNKEVLYVDLEGKDSGTIIGKRGQTLDAIQYLTSLVVNKDESDYVRVVVDAEKYRAKREKTLELLAVRLANKVAKTKKRVKLEPMNPYERKVIHATLQNHPTVTTRSEGQEPYRRVIIELK